MTTNLYLNEYGAINESMSDIMGNIIEMTIDDNPNIAKGTDNNDNGGVHTNSSLLNVVSYKLGEAGSGERMELKDPEW